jgi:hypothetical protein
MACHGMENTRQTDYHTARLSTMIAESTRYELKNHEWGGATNNQL